MKVARYRDVARYRALARYRVPHISFYYMTKSMGLIDFYFVATQSFMPTAIIRQQLLDPLPSSCTKALPFGVELSEQSWEPSPIVM